MTVKLVPRSPIATRATDRSDHLIGRGMDFALVTAVFLGLGHLLDRWLGTEPIFMITLFVVGLVGGFARLWYEYEGRMRVLDDERAARRSAR